MSRRASQHTSSSSTRFARDLISMVGVILIYVFLRVCVQGRYHCFCLFFIALVAILGSAVPVPGVTCHISIAEGVL